MKSVIEKRLIAALSRHSEVIGAYLFGSRAGGDDAATSDVDVAVLCRERLKLESLIRLQDELESAVGLRVDFIDLARAGPFLALDVVRGERVFELDGSICRRVRSLCSSPCGRPRTVRA